MDYQQQYDQKRKDAYIRARQKTEELKGFYFSLMSYAVVIPVLIYIWHEYTPHTFQWFWFPLAFWGFGLITQALKIYGKNMPFGEQWERKQIKKYMKTDKENTI